MVREAGWQQAPVNQLQDQEQQALRFLTAPEVQATFASMDSQQMRTAGAVSDPQGSTQPHRNVGDPV